MRPRREVVSEPELELCFEAIEMAASAGIEGMEGDREILREVMELREKKLMDEAKEALRVIPEPNVIVDSCLVNGEGASSSSRNE
jgi:hypothetical protein